MLGGRILSLRRCKLWHAWKDFKRGLGVDFVDYLHDSANPKQT